MDNKKKMARCHRLLALARETLRDPAAPTRPWFQTFMCMNIPIYGWFYLYRLAFDGAEGEEGEGELRSFARAYLVYKLLFFVIALAIFLVLLVAAAFGLYALLTYMELL